MGVFPVLRIIKALPPSTPPPKEIISYSSNYFVYLSLFSVILYGGTSPRFHTDKCEFTVLRTILTVDVGDLCVLQTCSASLELFHFRAC